MTTMTRPADYATFLDGKAQFGAMDGFEPLFMPSAALDFQETLIDWSVRKGRAANFADCGLGKTLIQLAWAENVHRYTNRPVLVVTPLAVSSQTVSEGEKFGIAAVRSKEGSFSRGITVTNYERLHYFDPRDFAGVACDESSILKSFDGITKAAVTEFLRLVPYRLLCTATAAPNDYIELGTHSEALGHLGYMDMLTRFFTNAQHTVRPRGGRLWRKENEWRFKGHAEQDFWRWVASWARACRKPSDLGFGDGAFNLPPLIQRETVIEPRSAPPGMLFDVSARNMAEEREVRRRTLSERCEAAARLVEHSEPAVIWCHLNAEADALERLIPDATQVSGSDPDEAKEEKFDAFRSGEVRVLVIKPRIGAFGLNWQHAAHVVYFPTDSYEQFYQAVRRCWRFGQTRPVTVDLVYAGGQDNVVANLREKEANAARMFEDLVAHMTSAIEVDRSNRYDEPLEVPAWL